MTSRKTRTAIAVSAGVWIAAFGAAAAITYELNRPLHWAGATSKLDEPVTNAHAAIAESRADLQTVLYVPTITLVGRMAHRSAVTQAPKPITEIAEMRCSDWRELDMGSGHVQVCE
jgi:hypothetical protein